VLTALGNVSIWETEVDESGVVLDIVVMVFEPGIFIF